MIDDDNDLYHRGAHDHIDLTSTSHRSHIDLTFIIEVRTITVRGGSTADRISVPLHTEPLYHSRTCIIINYDK